jgi:hypothetical protein
MKNKTSNQGFGYLVTFISSIVAIYFTISTHNLVAQCILIINALFLLLLTWKVPGLFKPLKTIWIEVGNKIGKLTSPVIIFLIYYALLVPYSIFLKVLFRYDPLKFKNKKTTWVKKLNKEKSTDFEKQY